EGLISDFTSWNGKLLFAGGPQIAADHDHYVSCRGFGAWDGTHWSALGSKFYTAGPKFFGTYQGNLIAVGRSVNLGYVARWDGSGWTKFGTGPPRNGRAALEYHNDLYVAHADDEPGDPPGGIARWDGAAWQSVAGNLSFQGDPFGAVGNTMC